MSQWYFPNNLISRAVPDSTISIVSDQSHIRIFFQLIQTQVRTEVASVKSQAVLILWMHFRRVSKKINNVDPVCPDQS